MSALASKSLVELRGIAQSLGLPDIFTSSKTHLVQAIEHKISAGGEAVRESLPPARIVVELDQAPGESGDRAAIRRALEPYIARGLRLSFSDYGWMIDMAGRHDEGCWGVPLRVICACAEVVCNG